MDSRVGMKRNKEKKTLIKKCKQEDECVNLNVKKEHSSSSVLMRGKQQVQHTSQLRKNTMP